MKNNFFDTDGYCRENSIVRTLSFFNLDYNTNEVLRIKSNVHMISFFKKKDLNLIIYIPLLYLLFPKGFFLFILNYKIATINLKKFIKYDKKLVDINKKAIIYYQSAFELYNIKEYWTHFFVELITLNKRDIYDSFLNQYSTKNVYNNLKEFRHSNHSQLLNLKIIKILIWEK